MNDPISAVIAFLLMNFTATFFVIGVLAAAISVALRRPGRPAVWATFLNWFLFFAIGVTYVFNGIMHTVFGDLSAALIGWENNGFQAEVGFASIGVGVVGFMAFPRRMPYSLKLAALVGPTCFLWGAAGAHIADIIATGNLSPHNAGVILYTDILIPIIGLVLWALAFTAHRRADAAAGPAEATARPAEATAGPAARA